MAAKNPSKGLPDTAANPVLLNRLFGILRTCWIEPTAMTKKRADRRLVQIDQTK